MAKCLVLGANGFIGSHLVDSLVAAGHWVRAFDRPSSGRRYEAEGVEAFFGDFLNMSDLENAVKDIDYVFHFISTTNPATAENDPRIDIETNVRMSIELFDICAKARVKRVIFASTGGSVYGDSDNDHPRIETDLPQPVSPYAIGKLTIEHYLRYFSVKRGLDSMVVRISNPYGTRQALHAKQGVIPIFIENMLVNKPLTVLGDGEMVRDYIYVKDVADILAQLFDKEAKHKLYNVGSGTPTTVNQIITTIERVSGAKAEVQHREAPATFLHRVTLDTSRLEDEFNLKAVTNLEAGIKSTYEHLREELRHE